VSIAHVERLQKAGMSIYLDRPDQPAAIAAAPRASAARTLDRTAVAKPP
jgi:hypothetical protein